MANVSRLIKILRTSKSLAEIKEAANGLARSDDVRDHDELYRMARGTRRRFLSWYSQKHIETGLISLAETGTQKAKDFIEEQKKNKFKKLGKYPRGHPDFGNYPTIYERELENLERAQEIYRQETNEIYRFYDPILKRASETLKKLE